MKFLQLAARTSEMRADLLAEPRHLVTELVGRSGREAHLHVRDAHRTELVDPIDDAIVAVHRESPWQLPLGLPDVDVLVGSRLSGTAPGRILIAVAQDVCDVFGHTIGRRRLRDPAVAAARPRVAVRACPNRRSRSAGAAAAPDAGLGRRRRIPTRTVVRRPLVEPRTDDRVASVTAPRSLNGTPSASNSPSTWPAPTPKRSRPSESASTVANAFAVWSGCW